MGTAKKTTKAIVDTKRRREMTDSDVQRLIKKQVRENREALEILAKVLSRGQTPPLPAL